MKTTSEVEYHELDCPGCGDKIKIPKQPTTHTVSIAGSNGNESLVLQKLDDLSTKLTAKAEEKPKEQDVPSYLPKHFCKGKDCDGHANVNRKRITKKCNNCDQVAPGNAGKCAFCGEKDFDDLDDDQLEMFNKGMEHDHERE